MIVDVYHVRQKDGKEMEVEVPMNNTLLKADKKRVVHDLLKGLNGHTCCWTNPFISAEFKERKIKP